MLCDFVNCKIAFMSFWIFKLQNTKHASVMLVRVMQEFNS